MSRIFISYRTSTASQIAFRIYEIIKHKYGANCAFLDKETLAGGDRWETVIEKHLAECEIFLMVIDPNWMGKGLLGRDRISRPDDWVRREVRAILERNRNPRPNQPKCLIVPLIIDCPAPNIEDLPPDIRAAFDNQALSLRTGQDFTILWDLIDRRLGDQPMGAFSSAFFRGAPAALRNASFRLRGVRHIEDLHPFVELSDAEAVIAEANPDLSGERRLDLYRLWCEATSLQPEPGSDYDTRAFLILDRQNDDGSFTPISVSIVLPLRKSGVSKLITNASDGRKINAVESLDAEDFERGASNALLVDTWITRRSEHLTPFAGITRAKHFGYGITLVLRHIQWAGNIEASGSYFIASEPDNPHIARMLAQTGFQRICRNSASGDIFYFQYPLNEFLFDDRQLQELRESIDKIAALSAIPIH